MNREEQVLDELGIGFVSYSPLGRGYLTGKLDQNTTFDQNDNRGELPRFTQEAMKANQVLLDFMQKVAESKNVTTAQIALAWILDQKPWIVPIPGTTKKERILENIKALDVTFTSEEKTIIAKGLQEIRIVGERYPESERRRAGR